MTQKEDELRSEQEIVLSRLDYEAVLFDLDGVVTRTAKVHAKAWKRLFDTYLENRARREGDKFEPFSVDSDYTRYVDGKPRYDGVESFLESRGIELPRGTPDDPPSEETICGLGNRKNELFTDVLERDGVETYQSTVDLINDLRARTFKTAIISSSKNCSRVLEQAGLSDLFDAKVDGRDAERLSLEGKPAPDIFLAAAHRLLVNPGMAVVVEDALAGVEAGKRGGFGFVIGVDRAEQSEKLLERGADVVVTDLSEVQIGDAPPPEETDIDNLPSALDHIEDIGEQVARRGLALFLDYDGTLTPIVDHPEDAVLHDVMRGIVQRLSKKSPVAVISGRDLEDVRALVRIDDIVYAGSHGFDIEGNLPGQKSISYQRGNHFLPILDEAEKKLKDLLSDVRGAQVERKKYSIAIHYRNVEEEDVPRVEEAVDRVHADEESLEKSSGKKVWELRPGIEWDKGKALWWLIERFGFDRKSILPVYIGDDTTDEDAFRALRGEGVGIVVADENRKTLAQYRLRDPDEVGQFIDALRTTMEEHS